MNRNITSALFFLLACGAPGAVKDRGFDGTWVLDERSPRPGDAPDKMETRIKVKGPNVIIQSTFSEPSGGMVPLVYLGILTTTMNLGIDGQEKENSVGPFDIQSRTMINGLQMLTDWIATILGTQVQGHWTYTLSNDAKHMIVEIKETSTRGQHGEATLYFVRK